MAYEKGKPEPGIKAKLLDDRVRGNNDFIQPAINQDHEFTDANASEQSGKHMVVTFKEQSTPGASAANEAYLTAVDSGTQPELEFTSEDGTAITLTSDGSMGSASTDVSVNDATVAGVLNVTGATGIDGNFDVNTDKFTVDTDGNTVVAGTLDVAGNIDPTSYETTNGGFKDDDTMASPSATSVASQQSIATYVDNSVTDGYDPVTETGDSQTKGTTTLPNGLKIGYGTETVAADSVDPVTPAGGFVRIYTVTATILENSIITRDPPKIGSISNTTFQLRNTSGVQLTYTWICIGR